MLTVTGLLSDGFKVKTLSGLGSIVLLGLVKRIVFLCGVQGACPCPGQGLCPAGECPSGETGLPGFLSWGRREEADGVCGMSVAAWAWEDARVWMLGTAVSRCFLVSSEIKILFRLNY